MNRPRPPFCPVGSIANHLRTLVSQAGAAVDATLVEQALQVATSDANLDMVAAIIEKAAGDKGIREVEEELAPSVAVRKTTREKSGRPYYDANMMQASRYER